MRVVMRTSPPAPDEEGCTARSSRPAVPVVAEDPGDPPRQRELRGRAGSCRRGAAPGGRAVGDARPERGEPGTQPAEQRLELRRGGAGLEIVEQRVVGGSARRSARQSASARFSATIRCERRREGREVVGRPRRLPGGLRLDRGGGQLGGEPAPAPWRRRRCRRAASARLTAPAASCGAGGGDPVGDARVGRERVQRRGDRGRVLGALGRALRRHLGLLVPVQQPRHLLQRRDPAQVLR